MNLTGTTTPGQSEPESDQMYNTVSRVPESEPQHLMHFSVCSFSDSSCTNSYIILLFVSFSHEG